MAAQQKSSWLAAKLEPRRSGELEVSVRLRSGQVSTFKLDSKSQLKQLKSLVKANAILDENEARTVLMYLGKRMEDDEKTLEAYGVADGACVIEAIAPESRDDLEAFRTAAVDEIRKGSRHHTEELYDRIKHNQPRGEDLDYDKISWHLDYKPYAEYVPPKNGKPQFQAEAYEPGGAEAGRRDYYTRPTAA